VGYSILDVKIDGVSIGVVATYTFNSVSQNHSIEASFKETATGVEYTITATAGPHGTIAPSGSVKVASGATQTFQIYPDVGYSILDVKIDGVSIGVVATYTFNSVSQNHSIEVNFKGTTKEGKPTPWIPLLLLGD